MNRILCTDSKYFNAIVVLLAAIAIIVAVKFGRNQQTSSDPHGSLLLSQAIVEHGSIRLDDYRQYFGNYSEWAFYEKDGHSYYLWPLGTPLVAAPFVAVARFFGGDMTRDEATMQLLIAAVVLLFSFLVMQRIAYFYLDRIVGSLAASVFLFGTSFISTGATALWSHNLAALFALLAILMLLLEKNAGRRNGWPLMACFLFMAYLCRPTMLLLAPVLLAAQFIYVDRASALKAGFSLVLLAAGFVAFSWHEFHQLLPDYYLPKRLAGSTFWLAVYGNLASPSRGLFVFSPFLLLPVITSPFLWKNYPGYRAELSLVVWPVLHLVAISKFPHWWGGWSYGPRLMYDALPGLFLLFVIFLSTVGIRSALGRITWLTAIFAVAVNFGQGIFNDATSMWNRDVDVDHHAERVFDWRCPQFLHTIIKHEQGCPKYTELAPVP